MTRLKSLLLAVPMMGTGCIALTPIGPITPKMFPPLPPPQGAPADATQRPQLPPGPPPPTPTFLIGPGEVGTSDGHDAAKRLAREIEADRKALDAMPHYAEVSTVSAGR